MRTLYRDLRFSLRLLRASPGFAILAILTLAVGIAASTTAFGWVDGLLLRPFAGVSDGHQLAVLLMRMAGAPNGSDMTSYLDYRDYRDNLKSISGLAADHSWDVLRIGDAADAQTVLGQLVSGNYFAVLGVKPALGRAFRPEENSDKLGAHPVAVISHRLWRERFQEDPRAIGKTLRVNRCELTIVGVAPAEFRGTMPALAFDIWIPLTMGVELGILDESAFRDRGNRSLYPLARLRPGIPVEQAGVEAATFGRSLAAAFPDTNDTVSATILPVWRSNNGAPGLLLTPLRILMAVSVLVLLIACTNVANLLLARSVARRKEFSIRLALGAGRGRLLRQLLTESLLLAGAAAIAGLPLAVLMANGLPGLVPQIGLSIVSGFQLSGRVLGFTVLVCVVSAVVASTAPALFWLRSDVNDALKEGGRSGTSGARSQRMRSLLVVSEIALATVTLVGTGLFLRSFENARSIHPGFDRSNVVLVRFYMGGTGYSTAQLQQFCVRMSERLRSAAGISGVNYADFAPLGSNAGPWATVEIEGYVPGLNESLNVNRALVAPGYFSLLRIPLLEGRDFRESDDLNSTPVMIVNESFARRYFSGGNPVGRRVRCWGQWFTVVGLARDSKYFNIAETPLPHFYAPFRQQYRGSQQIYFFIKAAGDPAPVLAGLRHDVAATDPNAGAFHSMLLTAWTEITLLPQKVAASLLAGLGMISLVLAGVGLYSVMAYAVTQRTQEFGVRMALGAEPRHVLADVLRRGMVLTMAGLVAGIAIALAVTRLVSSMLVNVGAADPLTFAGAALFLASVAFLACYLPARRATKVDPMVALRWE